MVRLLAVLGAVTLVGVLVAVWGELRAQAPPPATMESGHSHLRRA